MNKQKAPVSFKGKKKTHTDSNFDLHVSPLIIYFMLAISLGQIFHLNSFKNPFWDFTHAVINNAFLVLMSNG